MFFGFKKMQMKSGLRGLWIFEPINGQAASLITKLKILVCFSLFPFPVQQFIQYDQDSADRYETVSKVENGKGENIVDMERNVIDDIVKTYAVNQIANGTTDHQQKAKSRQRFFRSCIFP